MIFLIKPRLLIVNVFPNKTFIAMFDDTGGKSSPPDKKRERTRNASVLGRSPPLRSEIQWRRDAWNMVELGSSGVGSVDRWSIAVGD